MRRISRGLAGFEKAASCTLVVVILTAVVLQVVSRYVFHSPLVWTEEVARFALVWLALLGAAYAMSQRLHVSVDLLVTRLGRFGKLVIETLAHLLVVAAAAVLAVAGTQFAARSVHVLAPGTGLPMSVVYTAGAVGFALVAFHAAVNIIEGIRDPDTVPDALEGIEKEGI